MGKDHDMRYWNAVIRQALIAKLLSKDIENYGTLKVTPKGREFLEKPYSFLLVQDHDYDKDDDDAAGAEAGSSAADPTLFAMLKDLRKKDGEGQKITSICNLPGSIVAGYGYPLPYYHTGITKYDRGGCRKSPSGLEKNSAI